MTTMTGLREVKRSSPQNGGGRFDRFLERYAPRWFAAREVARLRAQEAQTRARTARDLEKQFRAAGTGGYPQAQARRGYTSWDPGEGSADAEVLPDLHSLRARSRDLCRIDPSASGLRDMWVEQVVGSGIRPQSRVRWDRIPGLDRDGARRFRDDAEIFYERAMRRADTTGQLDDAESQRLMMTSLFQNGDHFVVDRAEIPGQVLAHEHIESDRVETPQRFIRDERIRAGVERRQVAGTWIPAAYYVFGQHPGDDSGSFQEKFVRVPRFRSDGRPNIHHLYQIARAEQTRGIPFIATGLEIFKQAQEYMQAEMWAAKTAACFSLFVTTADPLGAATAASVNKTNEGRVQKMRPGIIQWLGPNEKVEEFSPNRPATQFAGFLESLARFKGLPVLMPYEHVHQDFSKTNYSSGRMALTEVRRTYRRWQRWLVRRKLEHDWARIIDIGVSEGAIFAPGYVAFRDEYLRAIWVGAGWSWVDPAKEVRAEVEAYQSKMTTLSDVYAARGEDWEEKLEQLAREEEKMAELGLSVERVMESIGDEADDTGIDDPDDDPESEEEDDETETEEDDADD